jgi:hypothetical protein
LAQLVARFLHTEEVIGSSPVSPTMSARHPCRVHRVMGKLRLRATYLFSRARAINLPRLWRAARAVARIARRPSLIILIDMLQCSVRYECGFQDYQDWDFAVLSADERRTFMTHPKSDHIARRYNTGTDRYDLRDKSRFNRRFGAYVRRDWIDVREATDEELAAFIERNPVAMAKMPDSEGGAGVTKIALDASASVGQLRDHLSSTHQYLLEEFVEQHADMARLNSTSVNTLRIVTFVREGIVHVLARVLKIGAGGDVDNFSAGGMYTMLDTNGVALYAAFDRHDAIHAVHPISGTHIVGFRVPRFNEVVDLVSRAALELTDVPYVGWDVAVTSKGPLIIEANYNTGVFQAKPRASGGPQGLLPVYAAVAEF